MVDAPTTTDACGRPIVTVEPRERGGAELPFFPSACAESWFPGARPGKVEASAERREAYCVRRRTQRSATTSNALSPQASGAAGGGGASGDWAK